ncbi:uncharacterized protein [Diadema setosum]|uniref:uncharacterized protein n=1 Tax=Diadema setosum TaxID=31175 RepID=UPI003B3A4454
MDSEASKHSNLPKDEAPSTVEGQCCQKESGGNEASEVPERRSHLFVQYEEGNPGVYADFGATLLTDNQSHRLVDVDPSGVAHSIGLRHNDEIFFFNGVNVERVIHGSLVEAIRDAGPRLLFGGIRITQEEQSSTVEKGYVYVRLGAGANNVPKIEFHKVGLIEVQGLGVKVELFVLPVGESFPEINTTYELTGSAEIELSLTASEMNLAITSDRSYFTRNNSK